MTTPTSAELDWSTEQPNRASVDLDTRSTDDIVRTLIGADASVAIAVAAVAADVAAAADLMIATISRGGVVHYVGSGTSGRMGVLDAVELWPTFRVDETWVKAHLAGGATAMVSAVEGAEDDWEAGAELARGAGPCDLFVGLAASGRTPFVGGALAEARGRGLRTVLVSTNPTAPLAVNVDVAVLPDTGPEVLTGSTRLKAATAQKMVLNAMSTASMVRLGKTFSNLMIDMIPSNEKLRARALMMVRQGTGVGETAAAEALDAADGSVRVAIVSLLAGVDVTLAAEALASNPPDAQRAGDPSGIRTAVKGLRDH